MNINAFLLSFLISILFIPLALAQDNYLPPPLFAEPRDPPPRHKAPETKMPRVSKTIEDFIEPEKSDDLLVKLRIVPAEVPTPPKPKPVPPSEEKNIEVKKKVVKTPPTIQPKNTKGVVKGPKTMPAVKKKNVDAEITFENQEENSVNILERVQPEKIEETVEDKPEPSVKANIQMIDSLMLGYQEGENGLSAENKIKLYSKVVPTLKSDNGLNISIEAYASPQKDQMNGDRRLALSRAMAIRTYLMDQGIEPQRINVRSLGAQSNVAPLDRVEITLAP